MVPKLVSIDYVIRKVSRDLGLGDRDIPWEDMIEWIGHGLQHIGAHAQFEKKCVMLTVENYRAVLPDDFYRVNQDEFFTHHKILHDCIVFLDETIEEIELKYLALPIDERGFPLVPDNPSYMDALFWKCASQLAMRGELRNKELTFMMCDQKWKYYCGQARAEVTMVDLIELSQLSNQRLKLLPDYNQYFRNFSTLGHKQILDRS